MYSYVARLNNFQVATLFTDLAKFYEYISHYHLMNEAQNTGMHLRLVLIACRLYSGARTLSFQNAISNIFYAEGTVLAGCTLATSFARTLLYRLLHSILQQHPAVHLRNVVDDVHAQALGSETFVTKELGDVGIKLAKGYQSLDLVLADKKTHYIASTASLAKGLAQRWKSFRFSRKWVVRSLGSDATCGTRRRNPTCRARLLKGAKRSWKLRRLRGTAVIHRVQRAGPQAAALWGAPVTGLTGAQLRGLRRGALNSLHRVKGTASLGLRLHSSAAGLKMDPMVLYHSQVILFWAQALWDGRPSLENLQKVLRGALEELQAARFAWRVVVSPAHVFAQSIRAIGWQIVDAKTLLSERGDTIDLLALAPKQVAALARVAAAQVSDVIALASRSSSHVWRRPLFWGPLRQAIEGPCRSLWTPHHQEAVRSLLSQCHWTQARMHAHGLTDSPLCKLCGRAPGTLFHRRFVCDAFEVGRRTALDPQVLRQAMQLQAWGQDLEKAAAGIFPSPLELAPPPLRECQAHIVWINRPASGALTGNIFPDGSAMDPTDPLLSRAGWGLAQVDDDGGFVAGCYGAVPYELGPFQTARDGEDFAILMAASGCVDTLSDHSYFIDCSGTVSAFRDPIGSVGSGSRSAHLWSRIHHVYDAGPPAITKVRAHCSWGDVEAGRTTAFCKLGSDRADELAKRGALLHPATSEAKKQIWALRHFVGQVLRWAGEQEVYMADHGIQDADPLPDKVQRQVAKEARRARGEDPSQQLTLPRLRIADSSFLWAHETPELATLMCFTKHALAIARVFGPDGMPIARGSTVVFCTCCGAYSWGGAKSLCSECRPSAITVALRRQRNRAASGVFPAWAPQYKGWTIGPARAPSLPDLAAVACLGLRGAGATRRAPAGSGDGGEAVLDGVWGERMTTQQVCARFCLTPAELNSCADRLQRDLEAAKARKRPQRAQGSLIRDPSDFWADEPFPW